MVSRKLSLSFNRSFVVFYYLSEAGLTALQLGWIVIEYESSDDGRAVVDQMA